MYIKLRIKKDDNNDDQHLYADDDEDASIVGVFSSWTETQDMSL